MGRRFQRRPDGHPPGLGFLTRWPLARRLAAGPTKGYALLKRAMYASAANSLDAQLDLERDLQREAGFSEDYREGVAAFLAKRSPSYKGK